MSAITEILDRLSGIAAVKERLAETARSVDRSLTWLLDHEKRLIRFESAAKAEPPAAAPAARQKAAARVKRLPRKPDAGG